MTIILGIDPGSRITGYGLIKESNRKMEYLDSGCIRTSVDGALSEKLLQIYDGICQLMDEYSPNEIAIEQVFMHQNPNSALKLGHARGVAMVAAASHRVTICEYSAREIKQAVVGYGAAEKEQINHMVVSLLSLNSAPQKDAADALAIAICHSHRRNGLTAALGGQRRTSRGRRTR
ncbi:MAG: crossover junction endodeoxyribonuclease RuvC [Legionella sp.]|nr:MAG: crossover junction endodeoxyribonuclease RuvC [Legionella sp.]